MPPATSRKPVRRVTRASFSDSIRDAIDRDGRAPYAIAREAEVDHTVLTRFLRGERSVTTDTLDRLAPVLGLHLGAATRGRGRPRRDGSTPGPSATPVASKAVQGDDTANGEQISEE